VTAGAAVRRHGAAILVLPIRRPAGQKAASGTYRGRTLHRPERASCRAAVRRAGWPGCGTGATPGCPATTGNRAARAENGPQGPHRRL